MIGLLTGIINSISQNPLIIDVHDVGYLVHVPDHYLKTIQLGKKHSLYIHSHIREDAFDLYGFTTQKELTLFEMLLSVSGVGPKTALMVVDRGVESVETAVYKGDVEFFTAIPRLGTKNAQKIIIEFKGKVHMNEESGDTKQVIDALTHMGFDRREVREVIKKFDSADVTLEQKIRKALKYLGK